MDPIEFVDECTVHLKGGDGGNGAVAFRRESHVPLGGPNGGDGGHGGDVVLLADTNTTSLLELHRRPHRRAPDGVHGEGSDRTGADGKDLVLRVPVGTVVRDHATGAILEDLDRPGARWVAAAGGRGGRGNAAFANRFRRAPKFAERGEKVPEKLFRLELKLIADVGLVGYPSAGKSSLIAHLSAAKPRIADYPFTTLTPNLGVMRAGDTDVVLADVPGLIEGASEGRGLGHRFLRHIERTLVLVHVLDTVTFEPERNPLADLDVIVAELGRHDPSLLERPALVVLNKVDLPDGQEMAEMVRPDLEARGLEVLEVSAVTGHGLDPLRYRLGELVAELREQRPDEELDEELVIRLEPRGEPFEIGRDAAGRYVVTGERVERWVQMLPIEIPDAARYLQGRLQRAGVERALVAVGARAGDEVVIGEAVFDFAPELDDLPADEREAILAGAADDSDELDVVEEDGWVDDEEELG